MQGASETRLAFFPPVDAVFAALVKTPTFLGLAKDPACPNKQCRITEVHLKMGYSVATEEVRLSNVASLLSVYQAVLVKDLPEYPSVYLRTELGLVAGEASPAERTGSRQEYCVPSDGQKSALALAGKSLGA
ncbi:UNVERIFIED_CONTAM: hypothetical protein FKN15_037187 [Acipenser sinensis]